MFHSKRDDDDDDKVVVATAVAVAAEPATSRVRAPKPSDEELLAVMTPFCQAHAEQHGKEFGAVVSDLVQWAKAEAPKFNMTWEVFIREYVAHQEAEEEASRNHQNNLKATMVPTTSSSCSNAATTHDNCNKTLELLTRRLEKVALSIESNRNVEISTLKCSLEEAREQFEKETSSLRKEISIQKKELDELRDWDTVNITWKISSFNNTIYSSMFNVAQYTMRIQMAVLGDSRYGYLGFFICHKETHGNYSFPIQLGGSSISVVGNGNENTVTKRCSADSIMEKAGHGCGWNEFVARKDFEKKFVEDGTLTLKAKIRARRSPIANLNLK